MRSTLTYFSFLSFSAAKLLLFCETSKYFARKFAFPLTFFVFSRLLPLTVPLPSDFIAVHLVYQNLCQRRDGLKRKLLTQIICV